MIEGTTEKVSQFKMLLSCVLKNKNVFFEHPRKVKTIYNIFAYNIINDLFTF
jgi:hypothetical protein